MDLVSIATRKVIGKRNVSNERLMNQGEKIEQEAGYTSFAALGMKTTKSNDWILHVGASQHLSAQREWFADYQPIITMKIKMGDDSETEAIGKGAIVLPLVTTEIKSHNVLHVPAIDSNLLSVEKIMDHGHSLLFSPTSRQLHNDNGLCVEEIQKGNVYRLKTEKHALMALANATIEVWHQQSGHRSFDAIAEGWNSKRVTRLEVKRAILMALKGLLEEVCRTCSAGQQHN